MLTAAGAALVSLLLIIMPAVAGPLLAQADGDNVEFTAEDAQGVAAALAALGIFLFVIAAVSFALLIFITYLFYSSAKSIPPEHRKVEPGLAWTLLIPCVNLVMIFIVPPKIAQGFQSYFASQNRTDVGDCGAQLALFYGISVVASILLSWVPIVGVVISLAPLVLLIMLLVKFSSLKKEMPQQATV